MGILSFGIKTKIHNYVRIFTSPSAKCIFFSSQRACPLPGNYVGLLAEKGMRDVPFSIYDIYRQTHQSKLEVLTFIRSSSLSDIPSRPDVRLWGVFTTVFFSLEFFSLFFFFGIFLHVCEGKANDGFVHVSPIRRDRFYNMRRWLSRFATL